MASQIPSAADFRARLQKLSWSDLQALCIKHETPFSTVWKIRQGQTVDPGIEMVRHLWPHLPEADKAEVA